MSMNTQKHGTTQTALAEINVTPLVDVMLVLLIVFMVTAPMMQSGLQVDLPKANAGAVNDTPEQVILSITDEKVVALSGTKIDVGSLRTKLQAIVSTKPNLEVAIQADRKLQYGFIAQIMAEVKQAGVTRVGLVTEPTTETKNKP